MLPIAGEKFPTTADELAAALRRGFDRMGVTPRAIEAKGGAFPQLSTLSIDLTGAQLSRNDRLHSFSGPSAGELEIGHFEMLGEPLYFEKAPVEARLAGEGVRLLMTGEAQVGSLVLQSAAKGTVSVKAAIEALEELLRSVAADAAAQHGLEVKKARLTLNQKGPRLLSIRAEVTAKVFVMNAVLAVTGLLEIDDAFNARLSSLALDGDAMVTNLAGSFLRPRLQQLEGKVFPLFAFLPAGLKLRDIELTAAPALHVQAHFGAEG